jgi:hypothetical protein
MTMTKTPVLMTIALACATGAAGCGGEVGISGSGFCSYGGKSYKVGTTFPDTDGCNTCECRPDGVACTLMGCLKDGGPPDAIPVTDTPPDTSAPVTCAYGGRTYQVGEAFKDTDDCNTCRCGSDGLVACTLMACLRDASVLDVAPASCSLPTSVLFGPDGGMLLYRDSYSLDPTAGLSITRTYSLRAEVDGSTERSCSLPLPVCGAAGVVSLANIVADLADPDVQAAFETGTTPFFGQDARPMDAPALSISLGSGGTILVGWACPSSGSSSCVTIPAGVQRLAADLQSVASAAIVTDACKGL